MSSINSIFLPFPHVFPFCSRFLSCVKKILGGGRNSDDFYGGVSTGVLSEQDGATGVQVATFFLGNLASCSPE